MITIITPVYNGRRFIESCIQAVIEQDCPDLEHIIVDGASTDGTVEVIRQYAGIHSHIRWVSEQDKGQSDAMNKGIAMARGEILGILNVDDFYEPRVLNRVLKIFKMCPEPSLVVGNCNVLGGQDVLLRVCKPDRLDFTDLLLGPNVNPFPLNPASYFYHTSLHKIIGPYKTDEHYALDVDFLLRAVQVATTKYVNENWGNFRLIQGTKTYRELMNGMAIRRVESLLKEYRKKLSPSIRSKLTLQYIYYNYFLQKMRPLLDKIKKI